MPIMTANDAKATFWILTCVLIIWGTYGSRHSNNKLVTAINTFWIGAIAFMIMFYIFFSKVQCK